MNNNKKRRVRINKPTSYQLTLARTFDMSLRDVQSRIVPKAKELLSAGIYNDIDLACLSVCRTNKFFNR